MFLNQLDKEGFLWNTMVKSAKKQKNGMRYQFPDGTVAQIVDFPGNEKTEFRALKFDFPLDEKWFEKNGHIPLPPYIKREDTEVVPTARIGRPSLFALFIFSAVDSEIV